MPTTHRRLNFENLDDAAAEIGRLQEYGYEQAGQWSLGQVCHHLAFVMRGSLDGFPPEVKAPRLLRFVVARTKPLWLNRPFPKGIKLNGALAALRPPAPDAIDENAAIEDAIACLARLQAEPQRHPSPAAGKLTREEWDTLHRSHAAHHLGFLTPRT